MKLLLDENMPHDFRYYLPEHEVRTVDYMGWKGKGNGELIALAKDDFDALITLDQKIPHQHNPYGHDGDNS
jgi:predicted nuclease of predicted toxin-antitoxin system